jgi:hypothetical protein
VKVAETVQLDAKLARMWLALTLAKAEGVAEFCPVDAPMIRAIRDALRRDS